MKCPKRSSITCEYQICSTSAQKCENPFDFLAVSPVHGEWSHDQLIVSNHLYFATFVPEIIKTLTNIAAFRIESDTIPSQFRTRSIREIVRYNQFRSNCICILHIFSDANILEPYTRPLIVYTVIILANTQISYLESIRNRSKMVHLTILWTALLLISTVNGGTLTHFPT